MTLSSGSDDDAWGWLDFPALLYGNDGLDTVWGGLLADTIYGGAGADLLYGGDGNDTFAGGAGADTIFGDYGVDFLAEIPLDVEVRETSDTGRPIVVSDPKSAIAETYRHFAMTVRDKLVAGQGVAAKPFPRIVYA